MSDRTDELFVVSDPFSLDLSYKNLISEGVRIAREKIHSETLNKWGNIKKSATIPVYKVMITIPGKDLYPHRYILADTSRPNWKNFYGKSGSPVIGLWVDQSDMSEPDKVIMLIENPSTTESGIFEQDITRFPQFGVRNWLDVWVGYKPVATESLTRMPFGNKTLPDDFAFGNETHVFSGPIVSIKRDITSSGDRLQIIGFSPIIELKRMEAAHYKMNEIDIKQKNAKPMTMYEIIERVKDDIVSINDFVDDVRGNSEGWAAALNTTFITGDFTAYMFGGESKRLRVVPIDKPNSGFVKDTHQYKKTDQEDVKDLLKSTKVEKEFSGETTVYDIFFGDLLNAAYTDKTGAYAFIYYEKCNDAHWAYEDGPGHPGVSVRYGFKHEISNIKKKIQKGDYDGVFKQKLSLGIDAREMEGGIEYGSVFNVGKFIVKDEPEEHKSRLMLCPLDEKFWNIVGEKIPVTSEYYKERELWKYITKDIRAYGPSVNPIRKWLYGKDGGWIDIKKQGVADYVAQHTRNFYFAGMTGSVFALGNPSMKPGRVLELEDGRKRYSNTPGVDEAVNWLQKKFKFGDTFEGSDILTMTNFDKNYYIWKIRHYIGAQSGFITKVYYTETRHRGWQRYVSSISTLIQQALQQAYSTMGANE